MPTPIDLGNAIHEAVATGQVDASLPKELRDAQRNAIQQSGDLIDFKCRPEARTWDVVSNPQVELYKAISQYTAPDVTLSDLKDFDPSAWVHAPIVPPKASLSLHLQQVGRIIRIGTFEHEKGSDAFASAARAAEAGHPVHLGKNPGEKWKVTVEPRA
ncbi:hypothetical protein Dolphis_80 [Pseudomonas phage Dolphis]|nr:hypothetical protein Dolphis_80 [Pseudomonas phage Dolphis]